jgi:hypothetical protein
MPFFRKILLLLGFSNGGEGGIRTLDGLLTHPKTLRNQQLTDSQRVAVPCIPLISPSLAVGLAVEAQLLVHTLLQAHRRSPLQSHRRSPLQSPPWLDATGPERFELPASWFVSDILRPSTRRIRSAGCDQSPARQPARLADDKPVTLLPADQRAL